MMTTILSNRLKKTMLILIGSSVLMLSAVAQNGKISGVVTDNNGAPLEYANIFAKDTTKNEKSAFALTDETGSYELVLKKKVVYEVSVSYLGYEKSVEYLSVNEVNETANFTLEVAENLLNEVVVQAIVPPVIYKQDTVIYDADSFATGEERKLKELLNQMPGIEVDRENTVYYQGERVKKILVEDEPFFGGNSELAVKSVPSDAVSKIEVLKEYNEVAFMSSVSSENELVINVKLKEEKKNFVFGDVEAGGGIAEKYTAQTNLFYYSPRMNVYAVGGSNNANLELLSIEQFIQLQGGFQKMLAKDGNIINHNQLGLLDFFTPTYSFENTAHLSGVGGHYEITKGVDFSIFGLYSQQKTGVQSDLLNIYTFGNSLDLVEKRITRENINQQLSFLKMDFTYDKGKDESLQLDVTINASKKENTNHLSVLVEEDEDDFFIRQKNEPTSFQAGLEWHKKFSPNQISSVSLTMQNNSQTINGQWENQQPFLESSIAWMVDSNYILKQNWEDKGLRSDANLKHYYLINDKNHLSIRMGWSGHRVKSNIQDFRNENIAITENNYGVSQRLVNDDFYAGLTFRNKSKYLESEIGVTGHQLLWKFNQTNLPTQTRQILTPHAKVESEIPRIGVVKLSYSLNAFVAQHHNFFAGRYVKNFNEVRMGYPNLQPEINHVVGFSFQRYNIINSSSFYLRGSLVVKDKNLQNAIIFDGIERSTMPYLENNDEKIWRINSKYVKNTNIGEFTPFIKWNRREYHQLVDLERVLFQQNIWEVGLKFKRQINKNSFVETWYKKRWFYSKENNEQNAAVQFDEFGVDISWRLLKDFVVKPVYYFNGFSGNQQTVLHDLNLVIEYQQEDSPFLFKLTLFNILDNQEILSNSANSYYSSENAVTTFPRYLMGSVVYEL